MPERTPRPCRYPGCPGLVTDSTYCDEHQPQSRYNRAAESRRGTAASRGYNWRWTEFSARYRTRHPICVMCEAQGVIEPSRVVDHITPLADGGRKYDENNLQALCCRCHALKTAADQRQGASVG